MDLGRGKSNNKRWKSLTTKLAAMAVDTADPTAVKFSMAGEDLVVGLTNGHDEKAAETLPKSRSTSRFKVNRVEFAEEPSKETDDDVECAPEVGHVGARDATSHNGVTFKGVPDNKGPIKLVDHVPSISIDSSTSPPYSPNPGDSYDTHNLKTFGKNTLETLPNLDHYRNMMSATGAMKKRPTLMELQQDDVEVNHSLHLCLLHTLSDTRTRSSHSYTLYIYIYIGLYSNAYQMY